MKTNPTDPRTTDVLHATSLTLAIPDRVLRLCERLAQANERAWVVGGAIRDLLRGVDPIDFDIATSAPPRKVMSVFERVIPTGVDHGTVTVCIGPHTYEVTTLRSDGLYSDARHPDRVDFIRSIETDLRRRDFTINAIAYDPVEGTLHDPCGGLADIQNRILHTVGSPQDRFSEDALRILRAARFSATLAFDVTTDTITAMSTAASRLQHVSIERKREELKKILLSPAPSRGISLLGTPSILPHVCEPLCALIDDASRGEQWSHLLHRLDATPARTILRLTALLLDTTTEIEWLRQFWQERRIIHDVSHYLSLLPLPDCAGWSDGDIRRHASRIGKDRLAGYIELIRADATGHSDRQQNLQIFIQRNAELHIPEAPLSLRELAINGSDMTHRLGIPAGPEIGKLLAHLLDAVLEDPSRNTIADLTQLTLNEHRRREQTP